MVGCSSPSPSTSDAGHSADAASFADAAVLFDAAPDAIPDAGPVIPVAYGLNDVSVLFPLPATLDDPHVLTLSSMGNGGPLLSKDMFTMLENAAPLHDDLDTLYPIFTIVAARIDPCFPDLALLTTNPSMCQHQLRLVAQDLHQFDSTFPVSSSDSGIHLLYDLSDDDFNAMAQRFLAVSTDATRNASVALSIHPTIAAQGLAGSVATELRATILAYAGPETLVRCTVTQGDDRDDTWQFAGFDVASGVLTAISIPNLTSTDDAPVVLQTMTDPFGDNMVQFTPASAQAPQLYELEGTDTSDGTVVLTASPDEIASAMQLTFNLETPSQFNANSLDCVTCHLAGRARERATLFGASEAGLTHFDDPPFNLGLITNSDLRFSTEAMRAFGYIGSDPALNQRVINESAAVASVLATILPPQ